MKIICHRGFWKKEQEQNTVSSFINAYSMGFGVELDVRDSNSEIVISHDPPKKKDNLFSEFLEKINHLNFNNFTMLLFDE